jgi:SAM-dependent methyltransferase
MKTIAKSLVKKVLPQSVHQNLRSFLKTVPHMLDKREAQRILETASDTPSYLDGNALEILQERFPFPPEYGWDLDTLDSRGKERAAELLRFPGAQAAESYLELGCWDGMVSCYLASTGKRATAIDYRDIGFDERASRQGVRLIQMDAADLQFNDGEFDFVFSYDAFEHVASPEEVLLEALRVVKKGGYIYLDFGPLYYSPFGEHAYDSITVPYCQFLFSRKLINDFAGEKGLKLIDFDHVNGWSLESYRSLWNKYSHVLKRVRYYESVELSHLDLMRTYPSCFRSKSDYFENFIVDNIKVLFRKTDD